MNRQEMAEISPGLRISGEFGVSWIETWRGAETRRVGPSPRGRRTEANEDNEEETRQFIFVSFATFCSNLLVLRFG